jgi:hypothetical protein
MKHLRSSILLSFLVLGVLQIAGTGCVAEVGGGGGVIYNDGPWFHDDVWVDGGGRGWYGHGGGYVHPGGGWRR